MMEYKGYIAKVDFDDEAGIFYGEVVNLRNAITFQGQSMTELKQAFLKSVEDYLALCAERGEEPEKPSEEPTSSSADDVDESFTQQVNDFIVQYKPALDDLAR